MVSARLLAEIYCKLRALARASSPFTAKYKGMQRPFGGLNVLFSGDSWQLPPPDGGFLDDIPVEYVFEMHADMHQHQTSHMGKVFFGVTI